MQESSPCPSNPLGQKHLNDPGTFIHLALVAHVLFLEHSLRSRHSPFCVNELKPRGQLHLKLPGIFTQTAPGEQGLLTHSSISEFVFNVKAFVMK